MNFKIKRLNLDITYDNVKDWDYELKMLTLARELARIIKTHIVKKVFKRFKPQGASLLCVLADSSLCMHTYPEKNLITLEIHTCGVNCETESCVEYIKKLFGENFKKTYAESDEF